MLAAPRFLIFGDFRFNVVTRELLRLGTEHPATPVSLGSRAAEILLLFLRKPLELVSKNEIMDAVWPGTAVEESNLTVQISALRRALGVSCIQTVPGRGYRWTLSVVGVEETDADRQFATPRMPSAPAFAQDARTIAEEITQKWAQAVNAGDAAALTALYTTNAALLPHGIATPQIGETSIRKYYDDFIKISRRNLSLLVTESKMLSSHSVFMVGTWSADVWSKNSDVCTHLCGTYSSIFVREGSDWRCWADTWNEFPSPAN